VDEAVVADEDGAKRSSSKLSSGKRPLNVCRASVGGVDSGLPVALTRGRKSTHGRHAQGRCREGFVISLQTSTKSGELSRQLSMRRITSDQLFSTTSDSSTRRTPTAMRERT
jgi:hypothetical protein